MTMIMMTMMVVLLTVVVLFACNHVEGLLDICSSEVLMNFGAQPRASEEVKTPCCW